MAEFNEDLADVALSNLPLKSGAQHEAFQPYATHKGTSSHGGPMTSCFGAPAASGTSPSPHPHSNSKWLRDAQAHQPKSKAANGQAGTSAQPASAIHHQDTFRNAGTAAHHQAKPGASQAQTSKTTKGVKAAPHHSYNSSGSTGPQARRQQGSIGSTGQFNTFLNQNLFKES